MTQLTVRRKILVLEVVRQIRGKAYVSVSKPKQWVLHKIVLWIQTPICRIKTHQVRKWTVRMKKTTKANVQHLSIAYGLHQLSRHPSYHNKLEAVPRQKTSWANLNFIKIDIQIWPNLRIPISRKVNNTWAKIVFQLIALFSVIGHPRHSNQKFFSIIRWQIKTIVQQIWAEVLELWQPHP